MCCTRLFEFDTLLFLKHTSNNRRQHIAYMCVFWWEWYIRGYQLWKMLRISCSFYYLVASTACFLHIMKIQVLAEREHKIETDVKEIRKTFFCELCNKQYKLAMEFEAHLSSYDHNHRKVIVFLEISKYFPVLWYYLHRYPSEKKFITFIPLLH